MEFTIYESFCNIFWWKYLSNERYWIKMDIELLIWLKTDIVKYITIFYDAAVNRRMIIDHMLFRDKNLAIAPSYFKNGGVQATSHFNIDCYQFILARDIDLGEEKNKR